MLGASTDMLTIEASINEVTVLTCSRFSRQFWTFSERKIVDTGRYGKMFFYKSIYFLLYFHLAFTSTGLPLVVQYKRVYINPSKFNFSSVCLFNAIFTFVFHVCIQTHVTRLEFLAFPVSNPRPKSHIRVHVKNF